LRTEIFPFIALSYCNSSHYKMGQRKFSHFTQCEWASKYVSVGICILLRWGFVCAHINTPGRLFFKLVSKKIFTLRNYRTFYGLISFWLPFKAIKSCPGLISWNIFDPPEKVRPNNSRYATCDIAFILPGDRILFTTWRWHRKRTTRSIRNEKFKTCGFMYTVPYKICLVEIRTLAIRLCYWVEWLNKSKCT
jgi:hypothetical protein